MPDTRVISAAPGRVALAAGSGGAAVLLSEIYRRELAIERLAIEPPSLNGLFLRLTGRELRD